MGFEDVLSILPRVHEIETQDCAQCKTDTSCQDALLSIFRVPDIAAKLFRMKIAVREWFINAGDLALTIPSIPGCGTEPARQ
jgi:hypothetical protein